METVIKVARILGAVVVALIELPVALLLFLLSAATLWEWAALTPSLAAVAILFAIASLAVLTGTIWTLISLGRKRAPILLAGGATIFSGATMIAGVKTNTIPCAGPS